MAEIDTLANDLTQAVSAFREQLGNAETERKKLGTETAETKAAVDRISDALDGIELKMRRLEKLAGGGKNVLDEDEDSGEKSGPTPQERRERKQVFKKYMRQGREQLQPAELKALTVADDTTGGYVAPPEFSSEVIRDIVEYSPMRELARIRTTGSRSIMVRRRTGHIAAKWVGEIESRTAADVKLFGMEELYVHEMTATYDVSLIDLEDTDFDLEGELRMEFSEQFGVAEGVAFISGQGKKTPEGILVAEGVEEIDSDDAGVIKPEDLFELFFALKSGYARNARWGFNRRTLKSLRMLKDGQDNYIWAPGITATSPNTILGSPYTELPDMPDIATGSYPIVIGDLKRYQVADRVALAVQRDPFTQAEQGCVRFVARKRVGGRLLHSEGVKKLKIA